MRAFWLIAVAALAAAALLPGAPLGIGVPLVALLVAAAVGRRSAAAYGVPALLLAAVPALRDAGWLVALDLTGAVLLASIAVAGGETLGQLGRAAVAFVERIPTVPKLGTLPVRLRAWSSAAYGAALGCVLVVPFGALFWSADSAFGELLQRALPDLSLLPARVLVFALVAVLGLGLHAAARGGVPEPGKPPSIRLARLEWLIPLALLDALFLAFVLVQLTVLFGGHDHVLATAGLTYAEYARHGFGELLVCAALTLGVVLAARRYAPPSRLLHVLLALLCALCLVVLASALRRLGLYEQAFGFTRLRISAHAIAFWLGGLLLLALAPARHAPRAAVGWTATALLAFTIANPDRLIAARNVDRYERTGRIDTRYLASLSADALPELRQLPPRVRVEALGPIETRLARSRPWSSWSLGRT